MRNNRTRYTYRKSYLENFELDKFDPNASYSSSELEAYTDLLLKEDNKRRPEKDGFPQIIFQEQAESRWSREVTSGTGDIDPTISAEGSPDGQRMYNRTHPEGRKINSEQQRKDHGASYYR